MRSDLPIVGFGDIVTDAYPSIDAMFVDLSKPVDPYRLISVVASLASPQAAPAS